MTTRIADRVDGWESRPFSDGYAGLRDLADASFSGVVVAGRATCCLLNGTIVGILDGSIEDFEDASGTAREAPSPALPLLIVMQDRGDEVRARYYSEETPLSAADQKLSDGGFTGYVELSENVLSGDYYVVYHGGRSMSVAYVGESEQLLTDDEAFERADDEVGIYKVYPVDIEPIEIPEPETPDTAVVADEPEDDDEPVDSGDDTDDHPAAEDEAVEHRAGDADSDPETTDRDRTDQDSAEGGVAHRADAPVENERQESGRGQTTATDDGRARERDSTPGSGRDSTHEYEADDARERAADDTRDRPTDETRDRGSESRERDQTERHAQRDDARERDTGRDQATTRGTDRERADVSEREQRSETDARSERGGRTERKQQTESEPATDSRTRTAEQRRQSPDSSRDERDAERSRREVENVAQEQSQQRDPLGSPSAEMTDVDSAPLADSGELERRAIPSVDPSRTWREGDGGSAGATRTTLQSRQVKSEPQSEQGSREQSRQQANRQGEPRTEHSPPQGQQAELRETLREREADIEALEEELASLEADNDTLREERAELESERERLESELQAVREERDELQAEVQELQSTVADLEAQLSEDSDGVSNASVQLRPEEAIEQTNLFVRYGSKSGATLKAAHDGSVDKEEVLSNLNLEYHTQFDAADAAVDDQRFDEFLTGTIQYRFVDWVVHELIFEIAETGHKGALQDLYDALPKLDRAELDGAVSSQYTENGEQHREQVRFDIVLRDRMGNPLAVVNINDSREAATGDMMTSLVTEATQIGESHDTLVGAFFLTSSFFDPEALETAAEATGGGLLSRDKRESFVRLSRKQGYHLCLVEARSEKFHLTVPEL